MQGMRFHPGTLEEKNLSANPKDSAINRLDPRVLE